jgi:hypothetical protein
MPPTYQADPSVYRVIFEDQNFRVIDALRKAGVHDILHSHPVPSIVYFLTDCSDQLYGPDGKPIGNPNLRKAGTAQAVPIIQARRVGQVCARAIGATIGSAVILAARRRNFRRGNIIAMPPCTRLSSAYAEGVREPISIYLGWSARRGHNHRL